MVHNSPFDHVYQLLGGFEGSHKTVTCSGSRRIGGVIYKGACEGGPVQEESDIRDIETEVQPMKRLSVRNCQYCKGYSQGMDPQNDQKVASQPEQWTIKSEEDHVGLQVKIDKFHRGRIHIV